MEGVLMAWIELHQSLWTHRKTLILADELEIDETLAGGHLARLWTWALDNAPTGNVGSSPRVISYGAGWKGDAALFFQALVRCGWLEPVADTFVLHDWDDYAGKLIEQRAVAAERKSGHTRNMRQAYVDGTIHEVRNRDGDACRYCRNPVDWTDRKTRDGGTYDHVIPGGPTTPENLVVACRGCNSRKGSRTPEQAGMSLDSASNAHLATVPYLTVPYPTVPNPPPPEEMPPADAAPAARRPARKNQPPPPMSAEERERLLADFADLPDAIERIEEALNHPALLGKSSEYLYVRGWLRGDRDKRNRGSPPPMQLRTRFSERRNGHGTAVPDPYSREAYAGE